MYNQKNLSNSTINANPINISYSKKKTNNKSNYLTESSYAEIQSALRKDYFNRLQNISLNKRSNYVYEDEMRDMNKNLEDGYERPTKYAAKQIMFSNKIRKDNYNKIKKNPRKNGSMPHFSNQSTIDKDDYNEYKTLLEENNRKSPLPVIKKMFKDKSPLYYDLNYIDDVENKYIKPYLSNNNIVYREYIENKKSKAPFNFIIG